LNSKVNFYDSKSARFQRLSVPIGRFLMPLGTHASGRSGAEISSRSKKIVPQTRADGVPEDMRRRG
jgi:hypothetical protein